MKIQILGTGCKKCGQLAEIAEEAANELGLDYEIIKITDMEEILSYSVMMTPALAIDGDVKIAGRLPGKDEVIQVLSNNEVKIEKEEVEQSSSCCSTKPVEKETKSCCSTKPLEEETKSCCSSKCCDKPEQKNSLAKTILAAALVLFALAAIGTIIYKENIAKNEQVQNSSKEIQKGTKTLVYYFHGNQRCVTCKRIESYTKEAIEDLHNSNIIVKTVNLEEKANEHFITDYQLSNRTVVFSKVIDGEEVDWKRLDQVWNLVGHKESFSQYIKTEMGSFAPKSI